MALQIFQGAEDKDLAETWGEAVHDPKGKAQNIRVCQNLNFRHILIVLVYEYLCRNRVAVTNQDILRMINYFSLDINFLET